MSVHTHMHDLAHVCDEMSGILHVNVSGLHPNISAFLFERAVACFAAELIRAVACTLSPVPPGLPSVAVHGLPLIWSVFKPQSWPPREGSPPSCRSQAKFPPWSQQAKLCCFGFYRTVRVHSH